MGVTAELGETVTVTHNVTRRNLLKYIISIYIYKY